MADDSPVNAENGSWTLYKDRDEWKDVTPVHQNDGEHPVVQIAYSTKFRDVYDYFRAVLSSDERSDRALELSKDAADLNPANYTVWHFRRILLKELNKNLEDELTYTELVIEEHPKNYQIWHHRRTIVDWMKDPSRELRLTEDVLRNDAKNYHAWQHRQWVISEFNLWNQELEYIHKLLVADFRNNSAWNHRFYVISNTSKFTDDVIEEEFVYTTEFIRKAPNNESAWNYLRGVLLEKDMAQYAPLQSFVAELWDKHIRSPYLLAMMVDICDEQLNQSTLNDNDKQAILSRALELCKMLADNVDQIRRHYWHYMSRSLRKKCGQLEQAS